MSILSDRFNNKLLIKLKVVLGAALLVLAGSCSNDSDDPEVTCYLILYVPCDTAVEVQSLHAPENPDKLIEVEM